MTSELADTFRFKCALYWPCIPHSYLRMDLRHPAVAASNTAPGPIILPAAAAAAGPQNVMQQS
jgi:hypothetical protein